MFELGSKQNTEVMSGCCSLLGSWHLSVVAYFTGVIEHRQNRMWANCTCLHLLVHMTTLKRQNRLKRLGVRKCEMDHKIPKK